MLTILPFLLVFYEVATYLSIDMYVPALPQLTNDFGTTHSLAQLTVTVWFFGTASMQLILGPISDRYGRRPVLLLGGVIFVIASWICAITHSMTWLLFARFFQGCAVCSVAVAGYATIHELYDHKQAMKTLALMGSITILAPAFGPLVGGLVIHFANWRMIFWILTIWSIIALLALFKYMPESSPTQKQLFKISQLLKDYRAIILNKVFITHTALFCLIFTGIIAWLAVGPFLIINTFHYSPVMFGVFQLVIFGGYMVGNRSIKYALEYFGADQLIHLAVWIGLVGAVLAFLLSHFLIGFIAGFTLYALSSGLAFGPLNRTAVGACQEPMGLRMAVFSSLMSITGVLASIAGSALYNGKLAPVATFLLITALITFLLQCINPSRKQVSNT